jgi:hypothetical protein
VWERAGARLIARPLRYPAGWPRERPTEKGVDAALAVDFVVVADPTDHRRPRGSPRAVMGGRLWWEVEIWEELSDG